MSTNNNTSSNNTASSSENLLQFPPGLMSNFSMGQQNHTNHANPAFSSNIQPSLINNRRYDFLNPVDNSRGTLEVVYGPSTGSALTQTEMTHQVNNMARNLIGYLTNSAVDIHSNSSQNHPLTLQNIRENTTSFVYTPENTNNNDKCEVCHENINNDDILRKINTCSHSFHQECIDMWFESHDSCPYCNTKIIPPTISNNTNNTVSNNTNGDTSNNTNSDISNNTNGDISNNTNDDTSNNIN